MARWKAFCSLLCISLSPSWVAAQNSYSLTYDAAGRVTGVSISGTNDSAVYQYNDNGALEQVTMSGSAPVPGFPVISQLSPTSGPDGTTITLTGLEFTDVSAVTINGQALDNIMIVSDTEIRGQVPTGALSGRIEVENSFGSVQTAEIFTNIAAPLPAPDSVQASDGAFADRIELTWSPVIGASGYDLYRKQADSNESPFRFLQNFNSSTIYSVTGLQTDTLYQFWVVARNATQIGSWSQWDTGFQAASATNSRLKWKTSNGQSKSFQNNVVDPVDESVFAAYDNKLAAFDADGTEKFWSPFSSGAGIDSAPTLDGNFLYFGDDNDCIYKISKTTGQQSLKISESGLVLNTSRKILIQGTRAITTDARNDVYAFNKLTGQKIWQYDAGSILGYGNRHFYTDPEFTPSGELLITAESGLIAKLNLSGATPTVVWRYPASGNLGSGAFITVDGANIYLALNSGVVTKLVDNGGTVTSPWSSIDLGKFDDPITVAPNGQLVCTDSNTGTLYKINSANGISTLVTTVGSGRVRLVVTEDNTIIKARSRDVEAFTMNGALLWDYSVTNFIEGDLNYFNGVVYVSEFDTLHAVYSTLPPAPPSDVRATNGAHSEKVVITWMENSAATGYRIYRNTSDNFSSATAIATVGTVTSFDDLGLSQDTVYFYWLTTLVNSTETAPSKSDSGYLAPTLQTEWNQRYFGYGQLTPANESILWGPSADPDGDGKSNKIEYAMGLNPLVKNQTSDIVTVTNHIDGLSDFMELTFTRRRNDPNLNVTPEFSSDLFLWNNMLGADYEQIGPATIISPEMEEVKFRDMTPIGVNRFGRVKVE